MAQHRRKPNDGKSRNASRQPTVHKQLLPQVQGVAQWADVRDNREIQKPFQCRILTARSRGLEHGESAIWNGFANCSAKSAHAVGVGFRSRAPKAHPETDPNSDN